MCSDRWSWLRVWTQGKPVLLTPVCFCCYVIKRAQRDSCCQTRGESRGRLAGRVLSQQHDICISQYGRSIWAAGVRAGSDVWKRKEGELWCCGWCDRKWRIQKRWTETCDTWLYINVKTHQRGSLKFQELCFGLLYKVNNNQMSLQWLGHLAERLRLLPPGP